MSCPSCQAANLAGSLFCVACSLPLGAPVAVAVAAPPAPRAARTLRLVGLENMQETGFVLALPDTGYAGTLLVGRADLAGGTIVDVDLTAAGGRERRVSRRHARLAYERGLVTVTDWESAHGTWVNKQRVPANGGAVLADGDELRLADFVFRVELR